MTSAVVAQEKVITFGVCPVTDMFQFRTLWAEVQLCLVFSRALSGQIFDIRFALKRVSNK